MAGLQTRPASALDIGPASQAWSGDPLKANRTFRNDRAEVGVGTLIVFIAMVLVAAVAAAVLINTTGSLQQRAQSTGREATQEVSSNLKVLNVYGIRPGTDKDVNEFKINVELAAGALPLDLSKLIVRWSNGTESFNYAWATAQNNATKKFEITCIRGACTDADPVMRSGDLVEIYFSMPASSYLATRTNVEVTLTPETGTPVQADFKTPSTYGTSTVLTLR